MVSAAGDNPHGDCESSSLLSRNQSTDTRVPKDSFHLAYIVYFILGMGYLLPWNAFVTAVDYFSYLYPGTAIDRVFAVVYMTVALISLLIVIVISNKTNNFVRINVGLALFVVSLLIVPVMDVVYIKGQTGLYGGFCVSVFAIALSGFADALVQGGIVGSAGELPDRYMQATVAGTAASGVIVSVLRVVTKALFPQNAYGLRQSANLYFMVSIVVMAICVVLYNVANRLPVIKYYHDQKRQAVIEEKDEKVALGGALLWRSTLWDIFGTIKWYGFGILSIYVITLCIFPGYITEDVHSQLLKDWYPILLITGFNVFDLIGKCLTPVCFLGNAKVAIGASFARVLFLPLFYGCLHGPKLFRTEIPVTVLTCLLGLTNGYLTSVLMILGPKTVQLQHAETAGIVLVLFLVVGLATGSLVSWFWVI